MATVLLCFRLAPRAKPAQIRLRFEGITELSLTARGDLHPQTPFGLLRAAVACDQWMAATVYR